MSRLSGRPMLCPEYDKNRSGFHKCLGSQGGPCCAQNTIKTAKAFTRVWVLKRPACALHLHTRPAGAKQLISVPKTVPIHHLCLWQRCDKTANRAYTSTCTEPCFQTFRLSLRGTGRDKTLGTIFAFLHSMLTVQKKNALAQRNLEREREREKETAGGTKDRLQNKSSRSRNFSPGNCKIRCADAQILSSGRMAQGDIPLTPFLKE